MTGRAERAERERDEALTLARERLLRIEELDRAAVKQREIHDSEHARSVVLVGSLSNDAYTMSAERDAALARAEQAERERDEARAALWRLSDWSHTFGRELCPRGPDTYGEGVRDAKDAAARIIDNAPGAWREVVVERDAAIRERDEARAALREALDCLGCADRRERLAGTYADTIDRLRSLLVADIPACPTCPGRAACDCPAGEMCEGSVAP